VQVIDGQFGKAKEEEEQTLKQKIQNVLDDGVIDGNGGFVLIVSTDEKMSFVTDYDSPIIPVFLFERVKSIMLGDG